MSFLAQSVYIMECGCGDTLQTHAPETRHFCADLNAPLQDADGPASPWPRRYRIVAVEGWGQA